MDDAVASDGSDHRPRPERDHRRPRPERDQRPRPERDHRPRPGLDQLRSERGQPRPGPV